MEKLTTLYVALSGFRYIPLNLFVAAWELADGFRLYQVLSTSEGEAATPADWFQTTPVLGGAQPTLRTWDELRQYYALSDGRLLP